MWPWARQLVFVKWGKTEALFSPDNKDKASGQKLSSAEVKR